MFKRLAPVTTRLATASFLVCIALPTMAQVAQPQPSEAPDTGNWMAMGMAILFGVAIGVGCFMSPKRTHQD